MGVDPKWPKPLPNGWVTGQVGGTCIDSQDHVFIVTRGFQTGGLTSPEGVGGANPVTGALGGAFKSRPSPPVIEFDPAGNVVNAWGNASLVPAGTPPPVGTVSVVGQNAVLPNGMHGCYVDYQDFVWIGGNGDGVVQKYTHDGSAMLLQIGTKFTCDDGLGGAIPCTGTGGGNVSRTGVSHTLLNLPAAIAVDPEPRSDHRSARQRLHRRRLRQPSRRRLRCAGPIICASSARWVRAPLSSRSADGGHPHCVRLGKDQLIYACDRGQNKINVYQHETAPFVGNIDGDSGQIGTGQEGSGSAWDIDFSRDPAQTFAFISDGENEVLWTFDRAGSLAERTPSP